MPESESHRLFAVCLPGLEELVRDELVALGVAVPTVTAGGVEFAGDLDDVYRVNVGAGMVGHLLVRVAEFGARSLQDLDLRGARIDWRRWLPRGTAVTVKATCRRSRIYHSGAAAARIARHLEQALGAAGAAASDQPVAVRVRLQDNRCTISLDSSGEPLHRRGWRLDPGRAPLREDLARALLVASGWDRRGPLLDPLMGSGTIAIEAAALARGLAPGRLRSFACEQFAGHDPERLAAVRDAADHAARSSAPTRILGSDRDPAALRAAMANAERAGVATDLDLAEGRLSEAWERIPADADRGALVTNPPYGRRLDDPRSLIDLYRALGALARRLPPAWRVALVAADRRLALRSGLDLESAFLVDSGGLKIRALRTRPLQPPG